MAGSSLVCLVFAYVVWYTGVQQLGATRTAAYSNLTPMAAIAIGWLWMGEPITPVQIVGAAAILGGVFLTRLSRWSSRRCATPERARLRRRKRPTDRPRSGRPCIRTVTRSVRIGCVSSPIHVICGVCTAVSSPADFRRRRALRCSFSTTRAVRHARPLRIGERTGQRPLRPLLPTPGRGTVRGAVPDASMLAPSASSPHCRLLTVVPHTRRRAPRAAAVCRRRSLATRSTWPACSRAAPHRPWRMRMKRWFIGLLTVAFATAIASSALAQGGGASSTGTIQGRVTDAQGAVLPGVTVTATSPSALGAQTTITSETGNYRFPALPPGVYTVTYELAGFNAVRREGIQLALGFTATLNIELALATLQETVTVTGESPVIDTTATRVQQNFKVEQLQSIPNGRDMWSLLAVTPGGADAAHRRRRQPRRHPDHLLGLRPHRPGARAHRGHQHHRGHRRRRLLLRLLVAGRSVPRHHGADRRDAQPRRAEPVHHQVGWQPVLGRAVCRLVQQLAAGREHPRRLRHLVGVQRRPDPRAQPTRSRSTTTGRLNVGGPIRQDKLWWFGTYRKQKNAVAQPAFAFDKTFDTRLWNAVGKVTYQVNQNNKIIGYYQWGHKLQPNRLLGCTGCAAYTYTDPGSDEHAGLRQLGLQGRVERHAQRQAVPRSPLRRLRLLLPATGQRRPRTSCSATPARLTVLGAERRWQLDRDRKQFNLRQHLLPRHHQRRDSHLQGRLRAAAREGLGRLRAALGRQPGDDLRQRRAQLGVVRLPVGVRRSRQPERPRRPAIDRRHQRHRPVRERHLELGPGDDEHRRAIRQLQGLAPRAAAAGRRPTGRSRCRRSPSRKPTSTPGTRSRRGSASSTTSPARAAAC